MSEQDFQMDFDLSSWEELKEHSSSESDDKYFSPPKDD